MMSNNECEWELLEYGGGEKEKESENKPKRRKEGIYQKQNKRKKDTAEGDEIK